MFKKLISNLPFNPSLLEQVGFYSKAVGGDKFAIMINKGSSDLVGIGNNDVNQILPGPSMLTTPTPFQVGLPSGSAIIDIAAGRKFAAELETATPGAGVGGTVRWSGLMAEQGSFMQPDWEPIPAGSLGGQRITQIGALWEGLVMLDESGQVWRMGKFSGTSPTEVTPIKIPNLPIIERISVGCFQIFMKVAGEKRWIVYGTNLNGQFGDGKTEDDSVIREAIVDIPD